MKAKKLLCALLCMVMVFALAVPAFAAKPTTSEYTDTKGNWAEHEIALVADAGIVGGYPDGSFRPTANITRGAFAKIVSNFMGFTEEADITGFKDYDPNLSLNVYVARCVAAGVMGGFSDGTMRAGAKITREQAAAMLCRAFKLDTEGLTANFTDKDKITEKLQPEVAALEATGLITGYAAGDFRPKANLTRAQMMVIISRLLPDNEGSFAKISSTSDNVTMTIDAMDDYTVKMFVPSAEGKADKVDFSVSLEKLPPIKGVSNTIASIINGIMSGEITQTVETGIDGTFNPKELFPNAYDFTFSTLKITINGKVFTVNAYGKESADGVTVISTPTKSSEAAAAMEAVLDMDNFDKNIVTMLTKGNSISIANGSYLQVGTERVCFNDGYNTPLLIDLDNSEEEITATVFEALQLKTGVATGGNECTIFIKSGTAMSTDKGTIKLAKDITITFNGMNDDYEGILSELAESDLTNITFLASLVNEFIGNIDGNVVYMNVKIG